MKRLKVVYRGPGTGLRLEDHDDSRHCIDVGGSTALTAPLHLYVGDGKDRDGAGIDLMPADVALLVEQLGSYLARHHGVPEERER